MLFVCVSLNLQGVTLSNRAASCADHPPRLSAPGQMSVSLSSALYGLIVFTVNWVKLVLFGSL